MIQLKDIVKGGIKERFAELRRMGIKTVMITGDNPLTAAAIAAEAGVDDFLAQATPEAKLKLIREYQAGGRLVAMTGDGTNDAPALAQADVAVAMNTGTQAAKDCISILINVLDFTVLLVIQLVRFPLFTARILGDAIVMVVNAVASALPVAAQTRKNWQANIGEKMVVAARKDQL